MGDKRHAELVGLQSELADAALKAAMGKDRAGGSEAEAAAPGRSARRVAGPDPLAFVVLSFLAGVVVGMLLGPAAVRTGRNTG